MPSQGRWCRRWRSAQTQISRCLRQPPCPRGRWSDRSQCCWQTARPPRGQSSCFWRPGSSLRHCSSWSAMTPDRHDLFRLILNISFYLPIIRQQERRGSMLQSPGNQPIWVFLPWNYPRPSCPYFVTFYELQLEIALQPRCVFLCRWLLMMFTKHAQMDYAMQLLLEVFTESLSQKEREDNIHLSSLINWNSSILQLYTVYSHDLFSCHSRVL